MSRGLTSVPGGTISSMRSADLPAGMRAAVVLRHIEGLTVEETADALGASLATVRSQSSRGLEKLRLSLDLTSVSDTISKE